MVVSFERVYASWFDDVHRWARALGVRDSDCDDLAQEVFVIVHRRLSSFDGTNLPGWLFQITRRKVRDYLRLVWVSHLFSEGASLSRASKLPASGGPLEDLETQRKSEMLSQQLAALTGEQRSAFLLFELEGRSGKEIAELQRVPLNTVWARIHTARNKLHGFPLAAG